MAEETRRVDMHPFKVVAMALLLVSGWMDARAAIITDKQWRAMSDTDKANELMFIRAVDAYADLRIFVEQSGALRLLSSAQRTKKEVAVSDLRDWLMANRHSVVAVHFPFGMDPDEHQSLSQAVVAASRQAGILHLTILSHRSSALPAHRLVARFTATDILSVMDRSPMD